MYLVFVNIFLVDSTVSHESFRKRCGFPPGSPVSADTANIQIDHLCCRSLLETALSNIAHCNISYEMYIYVMYTYSLLYTFIYIKKNKIMKRKIK